MYLRKHGDNLYGNSDFNINSNNITSTLQRKKWIVMIDKKTMEEWGLKED